MGDKLLFQWKKDGHDLSDNDKYRGTRTKILKILKVNENDEAHYRCFVKNDVGQLLSHSDPYEYYFCTMSTSCANYTNLFTNDCSLFTKYKLTTH